VLPIRAGSIYVLATAYFQLLVVDLVAGVVQAGNGVKLVVCP